MRLELPDIAPTLFRNREFMVTASEEFYRWFAKADEQGQAPFPISALKGWRWSVNYARVLPLDYVALKHQHRVERMASYTDPYIGRGLRDSKGNYVSFSELRYQMECRTGVYFPLYTAENYLFPFVIPVWTGSLDALNWQQLAYSLQFEAPETYDNYILRNFPSMKLLTLIIRTMHFRENNPKIVNWYDDMELWDTKEIPDAKVKSARWPKFLQMLNHKFGFRFTKEQMEYTATWVGENLKVPSYSFELVSGGNIRRTYNEEYFGSCMHKNSATKFYTDQPNVRLLRIHDEHGTLVGRALVWEGEYRRSGEPVTVLDRVYPSDGGHHIKAAMAYAAAQGWVYKVRHSINGELSDDREIWVKVWDVGHYPYMDTFIWTDGLEFGDTFWLSNYDSYSYELSSTGDDCPWESVYECDNCGDRVDEDEITVLDDGTSLCPRCHDEMFVYDGVLADYVPRDDVVEIANYRGMVTLPTNDGVVYSELNNEYYYIGGRMFGMLFDPVQITYGDYEGDFARESDVEFIDVGDETFVVYDGDLDAIVELRTRAEEDDES